MLELHTGLLLVLFFFNDTATTEIYTLSLHDALPIYPKAKIEFNISGNIYDLIFQTDKPDLEIRLQKTEGGRPSVDRKSTRLNSSHANISYAVFCLKKQKQARSI